MNRYVLVKAGIDFNQGLRRFNNNKEIYESFLLEFPKDTNFTKLLDAIKQKDCNTAFRCAHSLKGVAGNLSLQKLYNALLPLVEDLRAGNLDHVETLIIPVKNSYEQLYQALSTNQ